MALERPRIDLVRSLREERFAARATAGREAWSFRGNPIGLEAMRTDDEHRDVPFGHNSAKYVR